MSSPVYTFTGGVSGSDFESNTISDLGGMICKISEQVIRQVQGKNPLSVFDKMPVQNGDTIEQVVVNLASARAYDSTGANALSRKTPSISVKYFSDWTRAVFDTTVDTSEMRKVLQTGKGVSELATKVVGVLGESEKHEVFTQNKNLLIWGRQDEDGGTGEVLKNYKTISLDTGKIAYTEILKAIKDTVKGMQFVNSSFNTGGINRSTLESDIYIIMPYTLKNALDVDELSGVFNLDKAELKTKIIEIDSAVESKYQYIYIVDRNAILDYVRLYAMEDQKNADGYFWNYFLHTERLYGLSPLFDCGYLKVQVEA